MHKNLCNKPMGKKAKELLYEAQHSGCLWGGKTGRVGNGAVLKGLP